MKTLLKAAIAGLITTAVILPVTSFAFQDGNKRVVKVSENSRFKDTDTNGDGAIDLAEFMAQAEKRSQKSSKRGQNRGGHMGMMSAEDTNNDGIISRDEFSKPALDKAVQRLTKRLNMQFDELDRNEDGQLSKAEQDRPRHKRFERMDRNDDGKLSPNELMKSRKGMRGKGKRGERMGKRHMMRKVKQNKAKEGNE
jgi:Ca2+-binding EF-hand superfamily protein